MYILPIMKMCSGSNSFLPTSSSESKTPSSFSDSKAPTVMKVSITKANKGFKPQKESHSNTPGNIKPLKSPKSYSDFKSCDVNNVLQTIKRFDQKYSLKPGKQHKVIPVQNDIFSTFHTNSICSSSDTMGKKESYDRPKNSEVSHNDMHYKSNNDFIQQESLPSMQPVFTRGENTSFELNDRACDVSVLAKNTTSILEVQPEEGLNKSHNSRASLSGGHHSLINKEYLQRKRNVIRTEQTSKVHVSKKTEYQVSPKVSQVENCGEINDGLSDDSLQENFSFKLTDSEDRVISSCSNSAGNIITSSEAVLNSNLGHLHNVSFLLKDSANQELLSTNIPTLKMLGNTKKATELGSSKVNSVVSELSNSSILSAVSHGLFKSLPYKILTIEDLVAAHEVQKAEEEEHLDVQRGIKDSRLNRTESANKNNFNSDRTKILHSESEQKSTLEIQEEMNDEIEEEIEAENFSATSTNDLSVKTNSSYEEMMHQLSSHSETKYTLQQGLSKEESVPSERTDVSPKSLFSQLVSNTPKQEGSDLESDLYSSVNLGFMNKTVSRSPRSGEPSLVKSSSPLDSEESGSPRANNIESDVRSLKNTEYCSIGIQTDINEAYHPLLYAKNEIQQSSDRQPVMHSDSAKSHSIQEVVPVYRYYSRTREQEKITPIDLALSEILRHQIELTKHFINSQQRMYQAYCTSVENLSANYKPVTLEDTKQVQRLFKSRAELADVLPRRRKTTNSFRFI